MIDGNNKFRGRMNHYIFPIWVPSVCGDLNGYAESCRNALAQRLIITSEKNENQN